MVKKNEAFGVEELSELTPEEANCLLNAIEEKCMEEETEEEDEAEELITS